MFLARILLTQPAATIKMLPQFEDSVSYKVRPVEGHSAERRLQPRHINTERGDVTLVVSHYLGYDPSSPS